MAHLVWLDLEMTGLDPEFERIIEIATIVTDHDLNVVAEGPNIVINQSLELLNSMDAWNTKQHMESGLTNQVKVSRISEADAEKETLEFLAKYLNPGQSPLCGNTISHDRRFLLKYMPKLASFFHYRNIDVTSVKLLADIWSNIGDARVNSDSKHRALDDVYDSIKELKYYKENFLVCNK